MTRQPTRFAQCGLRLFLLYGALVAVFSELAFGEEWRQWRGPNATGAALEGTTPPVHWSPDTNIAWKTPIPGQGHSTPVVGGGRIVLTTAVPIGDPIDPRYSGRPGAHNNVAVTSAHDFRVICLDLESGEILWNQAVRRQVPHEGGARNRQSRIGLSCR